MSFASRHNKGSKFSIDTTGWEYKKLSELFDDDKDAIHNLQGLYISKGGEYGPAPVAICDGYCVNLPSHLMEEVNGMLASDEDIKDIKAGIVGFSVYSYEKEIGKKTKTCYSINWEDL